MDGEDFISLEKWSTLDKFDGADAILKWKEVPVEKLFCLDLIEGITTPKHDSYILHFLDSGHELRKCWGPAHFVKEIRRNRMPNQRPYFISHGTIERIEGRVIAKFEISYIDVNKTWDLFQNDPPSESVEKREASRNRALPSTSYENLRGPKHTRHNNNSHKH